MGKALSHLGVKIPSDPADIVIRVTTGDKKGAGTDANVWMTLHDSEGMATKVQKLNNILRNDLERGQTDSFSVTGAAGLGAVVQVRLWRDRAGLADCWYLDRVEVEHTKSGVTSVFPVQRWIKPGTEYSVHQFDSFLPQDDPQPQSRRDELLDNRTQYQLVQKVPGGPAQVDVLPADEKFSEKYFWTFLKQKAKLVLQMQYIKWTCDPWESLDSLRSVYLHQHSLGHPQCLQHWADDLWFGLQRVQGINNLLISLCQRIPDKLGVTSEMLNPLLEGLTLEEALAARRIFIIDLEVLEGITHKEGLELSAPVALFFLDQQRDLVPIAIQLRQQRGPDNPVFLPSDPPTTWLLAKMFYNNAEAQHHQSCAHLGFTHLLMEGICVSTHRNLSPSHPLFRLLAPHFLYLLAINSRGLEKLVSPGGWVDKATTVGVQGMFQLISRGLDTWSLQQCGIVSQQLRSRGVLDAAVLPHYPYRDDALQLFAAIRSYVDKVVLHFYADDAQLSADHELQDWRSELVRPRSEGGVGVKGMPGDDATGFSTVDQVVDVITVVIFQCSVGHASTNFQQYEAYGFVPNYPGMLIGKIPTTKAELSMEELAAYMPNKEITLDIMVITKLLSMKGTNSLGDFEVQYLYDPASVQAATELREELAQISEGIKKRNQGSKHKYSWLDPAIIPNSISI